jgi:hypothetical protein
MFLFTTIFRCHSKIKVGVNILSKIMVESTKKRNVHRLCGSHNTLSSGYQTLFTEEKCHFEE